MRRNPRHKTCLNSCRETSDTRSVPNVIVPTQSSYSMPQGVERGSETPVSCLLASNLVSPYVVESLNIGVKSPVKVADTRVSEIIAGCACDKETERLMWASMFRRLRFQSKTS